MELEPQEPDTVIVKDDDGTVLGRVVQRDDATFEAHTTLSADEAASGEYTAVGQYYRTQDEAAQASSTETGWVKSFITGGTFILDEDTDEESTTDDTSAE